MLLYIQILLYYKPTDRGGERVPQEDGGAAQVLPSRLPPRHDYTTGQSRTKIIQNLYKIYTKSIK